MAVLAAIGLLAGPAALAQKVTFEPSLELGQGYSDNVGFRTTEEQSDEVSIVRLVLPLIREWRTGRLQLRYEPSIARYDERDELDRDEHRFRFGVRAEPQRGTRYGFAARYRRTQLQGDAESVDDPDLFVARRTDRSIAQADLTVATRLGSQWNWEMALGGSSYEFEEIDGFTDTSTDNSVEDRTELRSSVEFTRRMRRGGNLGFQLSHQDYDLDVSPDSASDAVRIVYKRPVGRHADASVALGAYQLDSERESQDKSGVDLTLAWNRRFRKARLGLTARSAPSSGGALRGGSVNTLLGLTLAGLDTGSWFWRLSPRIAERDPNDPDAAKLRTYGVNAEVGRRIAKQLRLRLRLNEIRQSSDAPGAQDREALTAELALQWFPFGGADTNR